MGYEELIDTLIIEESSKGMLYCGRLRTDDGTTEVHFITSEDGDTVAKNLHEAGGHSGWTLCDRPVDPARFTFLLEIWDIDLTDRENAVNQLCMFH